MIHSKGAVSFLVGSIIFGEVFDIHNIATLFNIFQLKYHLPLILYSVTDLFTLFISISSFFFFGYQLDYREIDDSESNARNLKPQS